MTAVDTLVADLKSGKYSSAPQNVIVPIDDFITALNELQTNIGPVTTPQNANTFFAGPATGVAALPTFRPIVSADLATTLLLSIGNINFNSATAPVNGFYLSAAGTIGVSSSSTIRFQFSGNSFQGNNGSGPAIQNSASGATVPTLVPNRGSTTTGIGAQASGNFSGVVGGAEIFRTVSTGFTVISGVLTLTGGTLLATSAALTNNAAAQIATITNGPTAGNPTKWIPINDNGTTRNIPAW